MEPSGTFWKYSVLDADGVCIYSSSWDYTFKTSVYLDFAQRCWKHVSVPSLQAGSSFRNFPAAYLLLPMKVSPAPYTPRPC